MRIYIHYVGHGDSISLEFPGGKWGLVDCHVTPDGEVPCLDLFRKEGVERLAFLCLTHPHENHFLGISQVLRYFGCGEQSAASTRIDRLWDWGVDPEDIAGALYYAPQSKRARGELVALARLNPIISRRVTFHTRLGANTDLGQIDGWRIRSVAPSGRDYRRGVGHIIKHAKGERTSRLKPNLLSSALTLRKGKSGVLLGGDVEGAGWDSILATFVDSDGRLKDFRFVKVSHHGSFDFRTPDVWKALSCDGGGHAVISACGKYGLPDPKTLAHVVRAGYTPRCTGRRPPCAVRAVEQNATPVSAAFGRFMSYVEAPESAHACYGTCTVSLYGKGRIAVDTEFDPPIPDSAPCRGQRAA